MELHHLPWALLAITLVSSTIATLWGLESVAHAVMVVSIVLVTILIFVSPDGGDG